MVQILGENSKCCRVCIQRERKKFTPPTPPLSKDEGLKDIGHRMKMRNLFLGVNSVTVHIWFIMAVYYKMRQILLQNLTANLLENATEIYYKMR